MHRGLSIQKTVCAITIKICQGSVTAFFYIIVALLLYITGPRLFFFFFFCFFFFVFFFFFFFLRKATRKQPGDSESVLHQDSYARKKERKRHTEMPTFKDVAKDDGITAVICRPGSPLRHRFGQAARRERCLCPRGHRMTIATDKPKCVQLRENGIDR